MTRLQARRPDVVVVIDEADSSTGLAAPEALRASADSADIPIVLLTGPAHPSPAPRLRKTDRIVTKPFTLTELREAVEAASGRASLAPLSDDS